MNEECPANLDEEARAIWEQCRWIIEGGKFDPSAPLQLQALWMCRELREESRANAAVERMRESGNEFRRAVLDALKSGIIDAGPSTVLEECRLKRKMLEGFLAQRDKAEASVAGLEATINALRQERNLLIQACKEAAGQARMGRSKDVNDMLMEAVRIATGN